MRILIIEDNEILSRNIVRYFALKDIFVDVALDWKDWLYKAKTKFYDAIILDINLPNISWLDICKDLRESWKDVSIIMLTSMWTNDDIVNWLNIWADDYLVKPFEYSELLARINALLRRKFINKSNILSKDNIELDLQKHEVKKDWKEIKLSNLEFNLLKYLLQNKWISLSRQQIYEHVWWEWDWDFMFSKTIDVYVWYLRKKLWKDIIETKKWFWFLIN